MFQDHQLSHRCLDYLTTFLSRTGKDVVKLFIKARVDFVVARVEWNTYRYEIISLLFYPLGKEWRE